MKDAQVQPLAGPSFSVEPTDKLTPCFRLEKMPGCARKAARNESSWKLEERLKYLAFMEYYCQLVEKMETKELWGLCRLLSVFIPTRNANQCRIYHKQMLSRFQGVTQMLRVIQSELPQFKQLVAVYAEELADIFNRNKEQATKREEKNLYQEYLLPQSYPSEESEGPEMESEEKQLSDHELDRKVQQITNKEIVPTDTTIKAEEAEINPRAGRPSISGSMFQGSSFQIFQPLQNPVINEMPFVPPFWNSFYTQSFPSQMPPSRQEKRQREWQECNQLFLCWREKLSKLVAEEQQDGRE